MKHVVRTLLALLAGGIVHSLAPAAPPAEVTNLVWCSGTKDCLAWSSVGPVQHRVYQGDRTTMSALLNGSNDACLDQIWNGATTTGPGALTGNPSPAAFFWYLVVGKSCEGEGPAGNATAGARILNSTGDCTPASCIDGRQNGSETEVDCGGGCPGCPNGEDCCAGIDCAGGVCQGAACSIPTCTDLVRNGAETDVDCGGGTCPRCAVGQQCFAGNDCQSFVCSFGTCQAPTCSDGVKNGTETDVDCGGGSCPTCTVGQSCNAGSDCTTALCQGGFCTILSNGSPCTASSQCLSGSCVDATCCNSACSSLCQHCNLAGSVGTCTNIPNGQDPDNECAGSATCNGSGGCASPNGTSCILGSECQSGSCTDGVCCNSPCGGTCQACNVAGSIGTCTNVPAGQDPANECPGAGTCNGAGACSSPNGTSCTIGSQCQSGNCVDGVCCGSTCTGLCQACNVAGSLGTCSNVPAGTDPANECAGPATCNGAGACASPNGTSCTLPGQCQSGNCVDGVCCGSTCGGLCQACNIAGSLGTCTNIPTGQDPANECSGAATCNGSGGCFSANGAPCAIGSQCQSSFCVDTFCCDSSCSTTCVACSAAKKGSGANGACGAVAANTDPDNECVDAACNGAGACNPPP